MFIRDCHNPDCRVAFPVSHQASTQKFCSRSCAAKVNNGKRKSTKVKTRTRLVSVEDAGFVIPQASKPATVQTCLYCKCSFTKKRKAKYCSSICKSFGESTVPDLKALEPLEEINEVVLPTPELPEIKRTGGQ